MNPWAGAVLTFLVALGGLLWLAARLERRRNQRATTARMAPWPDVEAETTPGEWPKGISPPDTSLPIEGPQPVRPDPTIDAHHGPPPDTSLPSKAREEWITTREAKP